MRVKLGHRLVVAASLAVAVFACSESSSRETRDGGVTPDASGCEPAACGPIPDGCRAGPPAVPCGCPTVVCDPGCLDTCPPPAPGCVYDPSFPTEAACGEPLACNHVICTPPGCGIVCEAPPPGCHYEGAIFTGSCEAQTCGTLVCEPTCAIDCAAPPPGCHYEGGIYEGPCETLTCGTLICDPPPAGSCPSGSGPCCARSATVDRARITLRAVGIDLSVPDALANATIVGLLQGAMDGDRLNWLVTLDSTGFSGPLIRSAPGQLVSSGGADSFAALMPIVSMPALDGPVWSGGPGDGPLELPVLNDDGSLLFTLPLDELAFDALPLSDDATCVGARAGRGWERPAPFHAVIRVDAARRSPIEALGMDLCSLLAGSNCATPVSSWRIPPDVPCADTDCAGWTVRGSLALAATPTDL